MPACFSSCRPCRVQFASYEWLCALLFKQCNDWLCQLGCSLSFSDCFTIVMLPVQRQVLPIPFPGTLSHEWSASRTGINRNQPQSLLPGALAPSYPLPWTAGTSSTDQLSHCPALPLQISWQTDRQTARQTLSRARAIKSQMPRYLEEEYPLPLPDWAGTDFEDDKRKRCNYENKSEHLSGSHAHSPVLNTFGCFSLLI